MQRPRGVVQHIRDFMDRQSGQRIIILGVVVVHSITLPHVPSQELDDYPQMSTCSRQGFRMSHCGGRGRRNGRERWNLCHGAQNELVDITRLTSRSVESLQTSASRAAITSRTFRGSGNWESCICRAVRQITRSEDNLPFLQKT